MNRDHAERTAATVVEGLSVDSVRSVIARFLEELARCPVCDGSGRFTFVRDLEMPMVNNFGQRADGANRMVKAGTEGPCPRCGSIDEDDNGKGDPEFVAWHCTAGDADRECRRAHEQADSRSALHARCGYRVMLTLANLAE